MPNPRMAESARHTVVDKIMIPWMLYQLSNVYFNHISPEEKNNFVDAHNLKIKRLSGNSMLIAR